MRATQSVRLNREVREGILPPTVGQCRVKINLGPFLVETLLYIIQLLIVNYLYNVHPSMLWPKESDGTVILICIKRSRIGE